MSFDYGDNSTFMNKTARGNDNNRAGYGNRGYNVTNDNFSAQQRVRLQLDAVASESLSGTVFFEIGDQVWGRGDQGGALGADGVVVEVKRAYIDWIVPNTDLKVRMGIQGVALPAFTTGGSQILDDDVAGITLSNKFNDNVTLTAVWARPYNDNFGGYGTAGTGNYQPGSFMDNADFFALLLPLTFDGVKVTPWAMLGFVGPNTFSTGTPNWNGNNANYFANYATPNGGNGTSFLQGLNPAVAGLKPWKRYQPSEYTTPFWVGVTGEVTMWDPFRLAWDLNYGTNGAQYNELKRSGWYGTLLAEYKMDWATPGLYFWYSSGDDSSVKNGSERMANLRPNSNNQFSNYAGNGNPYIAREAVLGMDLIGTWGIGARLKDMSFLEGLKHTFRVNYFGGTNSPTMAKYITGKKSVNGNYIAAPSRIVTDFNNPGFNNGGDLYLTTQDSALEFGLTNTYKIYDNLTFMLDAAYVALWLDQSRSVWGHGQAPNGVWISGVDIHDAWNVNASFVYQF